MAPRLKRGSCFSIKSRFCQKRGFSPSEAAFFKTRPKKKRPNAPVFCSGGKRQKFSHIVEMSSCEKDGHRIIKFNVHHYLIY